MKKRIKDILYYAYIGDILIVVNIFFGIFVWMPSDLSPNFALAIFTLPFAIISFIKAFKTQSKTEVKS